MKEESNIVDHRVSEERVRILVGWTKSDGKLSTKFGAFEQPTREQGSSTKVLRNRALSSANQARTAHKDLQSETRR